MNTNRFVHTLAIQLIKQNRLYQAFADLGESPEIRDFLNL